MRKCDVCDCRKLCERIISAGATGITCKEVFEMVTEIIEKNIDNGVDE